MSVWSLLAIFGALWLGSTLLLSQMPWFRDRSSPVERLHPHGQRQEADWIDDVERWLSKR